ncbi:hypothetical protein ADUPG1_002648 [Aduncisulcus paluster]|uniref:Chromo domain-containing protein n=1 Tax=Aduncisulcus paluster TaxID=2918883 RepID=A0ABQ5KQT8_9EUKA|nr:hypothetical protein ADUPG1_002648 [Aduncisulcus paluster]
MEEVRAIAKSQQDEFLAQEDDVREEGDGFEIGGLVLLNHNKGRPQKLAPLRTGPYRVVKKISPVLYRLQELDESRAFEVHVKRMVEYLEGEKDPVAVREQDSGLFQVESIDEHGINEDGQLMFHVLWEGFTKDQATWEEYDDIADTEALERYLVTSEEARKLVEEKLKEQRKKRE